MAGEDDSPRRGPEDELRGRFEALWKGNAERALRFARLKLGAVLRQRVDSQDVLQEVLLEASGLFLERRELAAMDEREFFRWLSPLIEHKVQNLGRYHIGAQRRSVRKERRLDSIGPSRLPSGGKTPSAELVQTEEDASVRRAIAKLSPREREVVTLVHLQKLRVSEAARRMGKTTNATSVLLCRALGKLRKYLEDA